VVGLLADDLDRVLVRADRAVGAEPEEDRAGALLGIDVEARIDVQRPMRDVVDDADREMTPRRGTAKRAK